MNRLSFNCQGCLRCWAITSLSRWLFPNRLQSCTICCEEVDRNFIQTVPVCLHSFCALCVRRHISACINDFKPFVGCLGCDKVLPQSFIEEALRKRPTLNRRYELWSLRRGLLDCERNGESVKQCPNRVCGYRFLVSMEELSKLRAHEEPPPLSFWSLFSRIKFNPLKNPKTNEDRRKFTCPLCQVRLRKKLCARPPIQG